MGVILCGHRLDEEPGCCGACPFFTDGRTRYYSGGSKGLCSLFNNESHHWWCTTPRRCHKIFKKALSFPDGMELAIVVNLKEDEDPE